MRTSMERVFVISGWVWIAIVLLWQLVAYWCFTIDDAYISFRYAQNLVNGNGLVYNVGERIEGYTNFLWVILIAFLMKVGVPIPEGAKVVGLLALGLSLCLTYQIANHFTNQWAAILSVVFCVTYPHLIVASIEGLETPLFITFMLMLLWLLLRQTIHLSAAITIGITLALLSMTRPDGFLFLIPTVVILCGASPNERKITTLVIVTTLLFYGFYFIWRWHYYQQFLPNTFYAKGIATKYLLTRGINSLNRFFFDQVLPVTVLSVFTVIHRRRERSLQLFLWFVLIRSFFVLLSGEAWMGYYRFSTPMLPLLGILAADAIVMLHRELKQCNASAYVTLPLFLAIFTILHGIEKSNKHHPMAQRYAIGLQQAHIRLGITLRRYAPKNSVLACADAGALPYYSGLTTIDIMGLTDRHIAHLPGRHWEKTDPTYILIRRPNFIVLSSKTSPPSGFEPITNAFKVIYRSPIFQREYILWKVYRFHDQYFLWVFVKKDCNLRREERD